MDRHRFLVLVNGGKNSHDLFTAKWECRVRMLGPRRNPQARNLFEIVAYLQEAEGVRFEVRPARTALRTKRRQAFHADESVGVSVGRY